MRYMIRKILLRGIFLGVVVSLVGCSGIGDGDTEQHAHESVEEQKVERKCKFKVDKTTINGLEKGTIRGVPAEIGSTEKEVLEVMGEPKSSEKDHGMLRLEYPGCTYQLLTHQKDEPEVNSVIASVQYTRAELRIILGKPKEERVLVTTKSFIISAPMRW